MSIKSDLVTGNITAQKYTFYKEGNEMLKRDHMH
jgi:hypothetical protein